MSNKFILKFLVKFLCIALGLLVVGLSYGVITDSLMYDAAEHGNRERVHFLIGIGANPDTTDGELGVTALMVAIQNGHANVVDELIHCGASINAKDKDGNTALSFAKSYNESDIVKSLMIAHAKVH